MFTATPPTQTSFAEADASLSNGGLQQLFAMVLAGLAARTPRMVSATVMALARLTFEFAPQLQVIAAQLLPAICALLRSKAREIVKSVLGFLKVAAMRVPVELLLPHLKDIFEGVLLWADDSKNRYKLKVRHLVERLVKRCGYDAVAAVWPESEAKLLTAVRKEFARAARRKSVRAGNESEGGTEVGTRTGTLARTARASEWQHSAVFSDGGDDGQTIGSGRTKGTARTGVYLCMMLTGSGWLEAVLAQFLTLASDAKAPACCTFATLANLQLTVQLRWLLSIPYFRSVLCIELSAVTYQACPPDLRVSRWSSIAPEQSIRSIPERRLFRVQMLPCCTGNSSQRGSGGAQLVDDADAPMDLLDASTLRGLARSAAGAPGSDDHEFASNALGKMVITEEPGEHGRGATGLRSKRGEDDVFATPWVKRKRPNDVDSDDSDLDDLKSVHGLQRAIKQTDNAASLKQAGAYAHSQRTSQTRRTGKTGASGASRPSSGKSRNDTAARFKAKRAGGDSKRGAAVEPFAYWRLDKNLLNPRAQKRRLAKGQLGGVVEAETPARGGKAKKKQKRTGT